MIPKEKIFVLDGGLATQLETKGNDLNHPLWSAKVLLTNPKSVSEVHREFLKAGSDCICTVSYQLSFERCNTLGFNESETRKLLQLSVDLACQSRDEFWEIAKEFRENKPLVAASIGPYGAYLTDGSEYKGEYIIDREQLYAFHEKRWKYLAGSNVDLMACETIPNFEEIKVLSGLLKETPQKKAWISLSCRNTEQLADGTNLGEVAKFLKDEDQVIALGVNCIDPFKVTPILKSLKKYAPSKELIAYPNSGEYYNPNSKKWIGQACNVELPQLVEEWVDIGARWIGGCCRTGPEYVKAIRREINNL